ncbi:MAG: histidine phosphatase family protein [Caulobacterales bacterium 68-7]|nr:histidine phosphatase family protein [Caulobacterales bacterium]OJU11761.1 MAG: histidine phosphatase family protein [Caulobacterales bacterium 68-7]
MAATATTTAQAGAVTRSGAIVLARHGEPDLSRKVRFSAKAYGEWWAVYETKGLKPGQAPPAELVAYGKGAGALVASIRPRSIETAKAVCGERAFAIDPLFVEAPLPPPPFPSWLKTSPKIWGFLSRFWWWFFNNHRGQESRKAAEARAEQAADVLEALAAEGQDVLVMAHGFFNTMIGRSLQTRGWNLTENQGYNYWAMRRFERG